MWDSLLKAHLVVDGICWLAAEGTGGGEAETGKTNVSSVLHEAREQSANGKASCSQVEQHQPPSERWRSLYSLSKMEEQRQWTQ